jgi:hypothetical protein
MRTGLHFARKRPSETSGEESIRPVAGDIACHTVYFAVQRSLAESPAAQWLCGRISSGIPPCSRRRSAARRLGAFIAAGKRRTPSTLVVGQPSFREALSAHPRSNCSPDGANGSHSREPLALSGLRHTGRQGTQRSTNAFSITKWPGSLWLPSRKPRISNIWRSSSSMPGLPHIMMRSPSIFSGS